MFAEGRELTAENAVSFALGSESESGNPEARQPAWTDPARLGPVSGSSGSSGSGPRPDGGHRAASPLTPREHEIVLLIAKGLSNRKIADELVISPATAARHVANILAKLGFTSRTQVASWATRHEPPA
jgi:DNA-binding NarL/FixJ family response regulator